MKSIFYDVGPSLLVSIKHHLNHNTAESDIRRAVALLVERLGRSAVYDDPRELAEFRRDIQSISDALTPELPHDNLLTLAESAAQALETQNRQVAGRIGREHRIFHEIVQTIYSSLAKIAGESGECVRALERIDRDLGSGTGFMDLPSLKLHLETCLTAVGEQIEHERAAAKSTIEKLQMVIEELRGSAGGRPDRKSASAASAGRDQNACVAAIAEAIRKGTRHFVVVMVVNRIQPINARFGREAGDWMLGRFREHVESQILASDRLFRWTGPAMVALLERPKALDEVRGVVKRMLDTPIDETYEIGERSILIPISAAWSIFMLTPEAGAAERQIQTFIASQYCRDFV